MLTKTNICSLKSFLTRKSLYANVTVTLNIFFFVYVHLRCIANNLKKISKMSSFPPLEKFLRTTMVVIPSKLIFFLRLFQPVLVVSYLKYNKQKFRWITEVLLSHFFAIFSLKAQGCDRDLSPSRPRRDLKPSRPRRAKMGLETSLETPYHCLLMQSFGFIKLVYLLQE